MPRNARALNLSADKRILSRREQYHSHAPRLRFGTLAQNARESALHPSKLSDNSLFIHPILVYNPSCLTT
ncbi:MAG TPA: hypothetical protein EYP74_06480 [Anaerolineales bacterium]|nr:hypothetical protein [Anaerolineales bacterium]